MLHLVSRRHDTMFAVMGLTADVLGIFAAVLSRKCAVFAVTLLCCSAIAATLLTGLSGTATTSTKALPGPPS